MARVQAALAVFAALAFDGLAEEIEVPARRLSLRGRGAGVSTADVEVNLVSQLAGNVSKERLHELEEALRPMYAALPKERSGYLGHQAVQYALHRLLLQRHGWFIVGLEPTDEAPPPYLNGEWVPQYLQGILEQRLGDRGINLHEIAALAATLEDLVRSEASKRMDLVYERLHAPTETRVGATEADRLLETYMMMYLNEGNLSAENLDREREAFKQEYTDWDSAADWMQQIKGTHLGGASDGRLGHAEMISIANELGERFGAFNDGECRSLKQELIGLEGSKPGRVPLVDFYQKGLHSHWEFNEKVDYLRVLGALDEVDNSVILSNYLGSRPNCLTASGLYAVCCRNECEDLMGHLEREIAASTASPEWIQVLVSRLLSDTVTTPRELPASLVQRLQDIAAKHGGQVPLHGRLFAQWMHHAYPRECPYPHEGGVNPQTPDEWMREAGGEEEQQRDARASKDEVRRLLGDCATAGADGKRCSGGKSADAPNADLPWSDTEILLGSRPSRGTESSAWPLLGQLFVLVALLAFLYLQRGSQATTSSKDAVFEDELQKPGHGSMQPWKLLLALFVGGGLLEVMGVLDRFSFGCTLAGGLLLNIALLLIGRSSKATGKLGKSI